MVYSHPVQIVLHFHLLGVYVDWSVHFYWLCQGLPECIEVRCSDLLIPLHEVIHESLGGYFMEPRVPMFFCGEVVFLYCYDDLFLDSGVNVLIEILDPLLFLVDLFRVGS